MLNSEIIPTRCNNCVYSSQWLYSTCFGWHCRVKPLRRINAIVAYCWNYFTIQLYYWNLRWFIHTALCATCAKGLSDRRLHAQSCCLIKLIIFKPLSLNLNRRDKSSVAGEKMVVNSSMMICRLVLRYNWRFIYDYICLWLQGWCVVGEGCMHTYIHTYIYLYIVHAYIYICT